MTPRQPTYQGSPCRHGHSGLRQTSNGYCVECRNTRARRDRATDQPALRAREAAREAIRTALEHNTVLALYYPAEFEAQGWRHI